MGLHFVANEPPTNVRSRKHLQDGREEGFQAVPALE
jgi:hypothetical protein